MIALGAALLVGGAAFAQTRTATRIDPFAQTSTDTLTVSGPASTAVSRPPVRSPFIVPTRSPFRL
jgi:hypothetical protein